MFDLENAAGRPIYVHAKVCVVDDEWMTIGSDNLNLRSWTHDSELSCAVVDPDGELPRTPAHLAVGRAPRAARGRPAARRPRRRARPVARARRRPREPDPRPRAAGPVHGAPGLWAGPAYRVFYDPDGRPRRLRGTTELKEAGAIGATLYRMPTSIEAWWPRLSQETRDWLVAHNGDEVTPTVMAEINRAGGLVSTHAWGAGHDTPQGAYLPDDVVDWIEAVANGEVPPR